MLADKIVHVEKILLQGPERPEKGPRGGLVVWLMAVIVISLAPAMHPIAADIAVLSLTAYAISAHSRQ